MKKNSNIIIALALIAIALNMTYTNFRMPVSVPSIDQQAKAAQKVVRVIGRATSVFDGLGSEIGFLVMDGDKMTIARYDAGSMASQPGYKPQYINVVTYADGRTELDPITVEPFSNRY